MKNVYVFLGAIAVGAVLVGGSTAPAAAQTKAASAKAKAGARVVKLTAGINNMMAYDVTTIEAKPGEALEIQLTAKTTMPKEIMGHNFVLLTKATDPNTFLQEASQAKDTGYIPAKFKANVLASTALAGPGDTVKVTFTAPKVPGSYTFICTFPGHFSAGMKGTLVVK